MSERKNRYEVRGEWAGYSVRRMRAGWLVQRWSRRQGERTGVSVMVPVAALGREWDLALESAYNERMTIGDYLAHCAEGLPGSRVVERGILIS